jgi:hypothetical protein
MAILKWERKGSDNFFRLYYEDLVKEPERVFRQLCDFVAEPFDREAIEAARPSDRPEKSGDYITERITRVTKTWSDYLSQDEAREIEDSLQDIMLNLKYERYTPG